MENYVLDGAAVLSKDNIATTDNLIATALETMPTSAVAGILPVVKSRGPSSIWVEPWYLEDKVELIRRDIILDDNTPVRRLSFSCVAADDLRSIYQPQAFTNLVQGWLLSAKHRKQRAQLEALLKSPEITAVPYYADGPDVTSLTDDHVELLKSQIMAVIEGILRDFQLSEMEMSIVGPYACSFAVLELQTRLPGKIHFMGTDQVDDLYVFPTGTSNMSRAAFALFDYSGTVQRTVDSTNGEEVYFFHDRSAIGLNPIHQKEPMVRRISLQ